MKSQDLKQFDLPKKPGVYFFRKGGEILYIGKATSLADRVRSYFAIDLIDTRGPNILDMVTQSDNITFEETPSVIEALILEANLIKKHQPKYNSKEKDDKSFFQVIVSDEEWPRVIMIRSRDLKIMEITGKISRINFEGKIKYSFGPFPNGGSLRDALKIIRKIFPFIDSSSAKNDNYQFYRQLGLMPAIGRISSKEKDLSDGTKSVLAPAVEESLRKDYLKNILNIKLFFEGKKGKILNDLKKQMDAYAKDLEFEQAEMVKRKIFALQHINDVALIKDEALEDRGAKNEKSFRIEAYDIAHLSGKNTVGVMTVVTNGRVDKAEYRKFKIKSLKKGDVNDYASLKEVVTRRLLHTEWRAPDLIAVDGGIGQYNAVMEVLPVEYRGRVVSVIKDDRHKPKGFHGPEDLIKRYKKDILLANSESHRFAIGYHKQSRAKDFLA